MIKGMSTWTRRATSIWERTDFTSVWAGPAIDLIVIQNDGPSESWCWTARGWREPDEWQEEVSREAAEQAALRWYLEKDE